MALDQPKTTGRRRQRLRNWVFTVQTSVFRGDEGGSGGCPDTDVPEWDPWGVDFCEETTRYCIAGAEICPNTKRYHWQGYLEVNKPMDLGPIKQLLGCNHVHLEPRRGTQAQAIEYCKKPDSGVQDEDGNKIVFEFGQPGNDGVHKGSKNSNYAKVLKMSTYQEAMQELQALEPADYVRYNTNVRVALRAHFLKPKVFIRPASSFNVPLIDEAILSKQSVVLTGMSGAGKTAYAKAHFKNPLVCSHIDDLKKLDTLEHDGIVFDDMSFSHWPVGSCIHLLDMEEDRSINCRHVCGFIPAFTKRIFTSNKALHDVFNMKDANEQEEVAMMRRFHHVLINKKMF